jgi:glutathione S-transferase
MNSVELPLVNILFIDWAKDGSCGKYREFTVGWANHLLTGLERWLDRREYLATESFTVADILMSHVLKGIKDEALLAPYTHVTSYRDRCLARPAWKRTIDNYLARVEAA